MFQVVVAHFPGFLRHSLSTGPPGYKFEQDLYFLEYVLKLQTACTCFPFLLRCLRVHAITRGCYKAAPT